MFIISQQQKMIKQIKQEIDINSYLPKFYTKQSSISSKLNPLLKTVRENKINCLKQLQDRKKNKQLLSPQKVIQQTPKQTIFNDTITNSLRNKNNEQLDSKSVLIRRRHISKQIQSRRNSLHFGDVLKYSPQKRQTNIMNRTIIHIKPHTTDASSPNHGRFKSLVTKKNTLKQDQLTLNPKTAHVGGRSTIDHSIQNQQQFDEYSLYDFNKIKLFMKMPYFSAGKYSKIKKHLVDEIDLQEIQTKFYKQPSTISKYKHFCQTLENKNKKTIETKQKLFRSKKQSINNKNMPQNLFKPANNYDLSGYQDSDKLQYGCSEILKKTSQKTKQFSPSKQNCFLSSKKKFWQRIPSIKYQDSISIKVKKPSNDSSQFLSKVQGKKIDIQKPSY